MVLKRGAEHYEDNKAAIAAWIASEDLPKLAPADARTLVYNWRDTGYLSASDAEALTKGVKRVVDAGPTRSIVRGVE